MRRSDRAQDRAFCLQLIDRCTHGVVAFSTGEAIPYCIPLSLVRIDDALYFHCAKEGKKLDLLRNCADVCVTFVGGDQPMFVEAGEYYTTCFQSVVVIGTATELIETEDQIHALRALCQKLTPEGMSGPHFDHAISQSLSHTSVWRIDMKEISGKAKFHP